MGSPLSPPGLPGSDRPDQPVSPYKLDKYGSVNDPTDWRLWWDFNRDLYLRFANINTGNTNTGSDDFFLGSGQRSVTIGGRASDEVIDGTIVPALLEGTRLGGSNEFVQSALVAMTKIGGPDNQSQFDFVTNWFLEYPNLTDDSRMIHSTAAFALGLGGDPADIGTLRELAKDSEKGRELIKGDAVPLQMRAYATYGLGVLASYSTDHAVRSAVVRDLVDLLEGGLVETTDADGKELESNEIQVAAMVALSLVPLHVEEDVVACYCGTCVVDGPETSLRPQVTYLMRYFTADKDFDPFVRAHAATTLGRLVAARPSGMTERMKEGIAEVLIRSLERGKRQPALVKESAVLALGLIGDADDGDIDKWIRWALQRSARAGTELEKRFALVALAQIGGRPGDGEEPFAATGEVRDVLLQHLGRGKKDMKPWAAISLGVLGHSLREDGVELDSKVDLALRSSMKTARKVDDLGAFAIAAGLRQDTASVEPLLEKMNKVRDEGARGYAALALGLIGNNEAVPALREVLQKADDLPLLQTRAGLALGMLGESSVVADLLELAADPVAEPENARKKRRSKKAEEADEERLDAKREAAVAALGYIGDERAVARLCEILKDKEKYSDGLREVAMVAMGNMADRSARPWRMLFTLGGNYRAETASFTSGKGTGVLNLR